MAIVARICPESDIQGVPCASDKIIHRAKESMPDPTRAILSGKGLSIQKSTTTHNETREIIDIDIIRTNLEAVDMSLSACIHPGAQHITVRTGNVYDLETRAAVGWF